MLQEIHSAQELEALYTGDKTFFVMKHSSACGTSHYAFEELSTYANGNPDVIVAYVVIQDHRDISNAMADRLNVIHKSPQLFLIQGGQQPEVLWKVSHMSITNDAMGKALQGA